MTFLVDAQLPPALARWLRDCGYSATAVREMGLREATDTQIWNAARESGSEIITKDEDFAIRSQQKAEGPRIIWLRIGNVSNRALKAWFLPQMPHIISLIERGARLIEIR